MPFKLNEIYVVKAEKILGARLPECYRLAMMNNNGGEVLAVDDDWLIHPIFDQTDRKRIARTCNHIISVTKSMSGWPGWPSNALAIAHNGSGDALIFLQNGTEFSPEVYLWNHENGEVAIVAEQFEDIL